MKPCLPFLAVLLASCQATFPGSTTPATEAWDDRVLSTQPLTTTVPERQLGPGALFSGADWNDPSVVRVAGGYVMYASSDVSFDGQVVLYRLVSTDAQTWVRDPETPVLTGSPDASAWDHRAVETPSVVLYHGLWHLFYTGYAVSHTQVADYRIGHATSPDGILWTKDPLPLLGPLDSDDARKYLVAEPAATVFQDQIFLYFSQLGLSYRSDVYSTWQTLGLTRFDGTSWSQPVTALEPDVGLYPRWDDPSTHTGERWKGYSTPAATVVNDRIQLFFTVVDAANGRQVRLHHAVSPNGTTSWTQDPTPFRTIQAGHWDSREVRSPAALFDNGRLWLWWAGDDGAALGIGGGYWDLPHQAP